MPDEFEHQPIDRLQEENFFRSLGNSHPHFSGDRKRFRVDDGAWRSRPDGRKRPLSGQPGYSWPAVHRGVQAGHGLSVCRRTLNDSVFDLKAISPANSARRIGTKEEEAFLTGDGKNKPTGVFPSADPGVTTNGASITFDAMMSSTCIIPCASRTAARPYGF